MQGENALFGIDVINDLTHTHTHAKVLLHMWSYDFYAPPQKGAEYYVIPSELLSVCPSVCPSVRPSAVEYSCPVHNFDTV